MVHDEPQHRPRRPRPSRRCGRGDQKDLNIYIANIGAGPARLGDVPVELRVQPHEGRRGRAERLAAWRQRRALQPGRHRDARGRSLARAVPHVPGRLPGRRATRSPTRRPKSRRPTAAPSDATAAPARSTRASTRSRTSWTTPTTPACIGSRRTRPRGCRTSGTRIDAIADCRLQLTIKSRRPDSRRRTPRAFRSRTPTLWHAGPSPVCPASLRSRAHASRVNAPPSSQDRTPTRPSRRDAVSARRSRSSCSSVAIDDGSSRRRRRRAS